MNYFYVFCIFQLLAFIAISVNGFPTSLKNQRFSSSLQMGFGDMLKKALANDPNLPPVSNPGLSREKQTVDVEFLPSKKIVKALPGQKLSVLAQAAGIEIKYKCKKGDCGTCTVKFDGIPTKVCQSALPSIIPPNKKTYQIIVPSK
jgi:ferredoxin